MELNYFRDLAVCDHYQSSLSWCLIWSLPLWRRISDTIPVWNKTNINFLLDFNRLWVVKSLQKRPTVCQNYQSVFRMYCKSKEEISKGCYHIWKQSIQLMWNEKQNSFDCTPHCLSLWDSASLVIISIFLHHSRVMRKISDQWSKIWLLFWIKTSLMI